MNYSNQNNRQIQFVNALDKYGVPYGTDATQPGKVLINLGGEQAEFGGFVQCWVDFNYDHAVEIHFCGGEVLSVPPSKRAVALEALNAMNGKSGGVSPILAAKVSSEFVQHSSSMMSSAMKLAFICFAPFQQY